MATHSVILLSSLLCMCQGLAITKQRPYTVEITPEAGSRWGAWGNSQFCPEGSWVGGFQLKVEDNCGALCDDTALNGVKLYCTNTNGEGKAELTSYIGGFGHWAKNHFCQPSEHTDSKPSSGGSSIQTGAFIRGFQFRSEHETRAVNKTRHVDETAGNNLNGACIGGDVLTGDGTSWGLWSHYVLCPSDSAVCGLKTQVESNQGLSDDTALNQITFYCCAL